MPDPATPDATAPGTPGGDDQLARTNAVLAEWAARSATDSEPLVARLEGMGYEIRGKSEEEVAEVLRHPPTRAPGGPAAATA